MLSKYINGTRKKIVATTLAVTLGLSAPLALIPPSVNTDATGEMNAVMGAANDGTTNSDKQKAWAKVEAAKAKEEAAKAKCDEAQAKWEAAQAKYNEAWANYNEAQPEQKKAAFDEWMAANDEWTAANDERMAATDEWMAASDERRAATDEWMATSVEWNDAFAEWKDFDFNISADPQITDTQRKDRASEIQNQIDEKLEQIENAATKLAEAAASGDEDGMKLALAEMNETNTEIELKNSAEDLINAITSEDEEAIKDLVDEVNKAAQDEDEADKTLENLLSEDN